MLSWFNIYAPSEKVPESLRQSVYITNILSSIFAVLALILFGILFVMFVWTGTSIFIILVAVIFGLVPLINRVNHDVGRLLFCLVPVYVTFGISLYGKIKVPEQSYITYFDIRFIILVTTILPAIAFVIEEKWKMVVCLVSTLACLLLFDPVHNAFGLGYFQRGFTARSYYYMNYITLVSFLVLSSGIIVLKIITGRAEAQVKKSVQELNSSNQLLMVKNEELVKLNESMAQQSEKLIFQKKQIHESRELIAEANLMISQQQEKLIESNKELAKLVEQKTDALTLANEELIRHNNELRQFSYTVSHNLRAPVARLLGLTDLFNRLEQADNKDGIASMIQKSGRELDEVLKDLNQIIDLRNDLYRVREKIHFSEEWQKTIFILQEQIRPGYRIQTNFEQGPTIFSIRAMIQSILYNLVSNAIKYRNPERELHIDITTTRQSDQSIILKVSDNGLGINLESQKENVFKLYRRFHSHVDGKGLGLYLVKTQIDTLGGTINIESEINRGTTFIVTLPHPQNISEQVIFQSEVAHIYFDADINNTVILWKENVTAPEFRKAYQAVLHSLKTYNSPGCIVDSRKQGLVPDEEQQWLVGTVIPEAVRHGLKRIAGVGLAEPLRKAYMEKIMAKAGLLGVELKFFSEMSDAVAWMKSFTRSQNG
ncbi:MAG TPA: HAMP domain-containing sensor histidine kinase [Cyclobacteriaceae bacterium]|jgi:signal transduction histidine kinase|nr:HAMP domain-containing histidine kinase [Cytophagales bacterium]HRE66048.1 HAMP domain-containing sensor histidine kinase [Cyclobacteriaceae bacterium]HRF32262.1 HAMP domain-containing sensor histidine kinase [Cyclobacteriaceae bacterium]